MEFFREDFEPARYRVNLDAAVVAWRVPWRPDQSEIVDDDDPDLCAALRGPDFRADLRDGNVGPFVDDQRQPADVPGRRR